MNLNPTNTALAETETTSPRAQVFVPAADIHETPAAILIRCDLPGVAESDIEIVLENKTLTLTGPQKAVERDGFNSLHREYATGVYRRSFVLNRDVDGTAVKARLNHGVLEIEVPKLQPAEARRIPIEN
jgi:HSP20 family protein